MRKTVPNTELFAPAAISSKFRQRLSFIERMLDAVDFLIVLVARLQEQPHRPSLQYSVRNVLPRGSFQ